MAKLCAVILPYKFIYICIYITFGFVLSIVKLDIVTYKYSTLWYHDACGSTIPHSFSDSSQHVANFLTWIPQLLD